MQAELQDKTEQGDKRKSSVIVSKCTMSKYFLVFYLPTCSFSAGSGSPGDNHTVLCPQSGEPWVGSLTLKGDQMGLLNTSKECLL